MKCFIVLVSIILICSPLIKCEQNKDGMVAYIKGSLPNQIYRCIQRFNILRCLKYFVLLRLEARDYSLEPTNSTSEFLENILKSENNLPREIPENITQLNDDDLNDRLTEGFQRFFKNRPIKLHFIPNVLVKVVPNRGNDLEVSLKKIVNGSFTSRKLDEASKAEDSEADSDYYEDEEDVKEEKDETLNKDEKGDMKKDEKEKGTGMRKKHGYYLQLGLPLLLTPYMVFAGFLPMLIPVLKLATAFTTIVNVAALIGSIVYLARQHALEREMQQTVYFNPGYKERK